MIVPFTPAYKSRWPRWGALLALLALCGSVLAAAVGPVTDVAPSVYGLLLSLLLGG